MHGAGWAPWAEAPCRPDGDHMLLEYAFIALCLAQVLHFSRIVLGMSQARGAVREAQAMVRHLDWRRPAAPRRQPKRRGFRR